MSLRSAPVPFVLLLAVACSSGGGSGPRDGAAGGGAGGSGAAGTGAAGTAAAGTGPAGSAGATAGTGSGGDGATAGTGSGGDGATAGTGSGGGGAAAGTGSGGGGGKPAPVVPALNYQLTGTWPKLKAAIATKPGKLTYTKVTITELYLAQSCSIADYNKDGAPDVSAGRRWYEGPTFKTEHVFRGGHDALPATGAGPEINTGVSDDQSDFAFDLDDDGWPDIINIANSDTREDANPSPAPAPQKHATAYWYKNPGPGLAGDPLWKPTLMHDDVRLEQHGVADVDGDGKPEILGACLGCTPTRETKGYYQANPASADLPWTYHAVTIRYAFPFGGAGYMHGLGFGDVDGDGRPDLLERGGAWLQQPGGGWNATACPAAGCGWIGAAFFDGLPDSAGNKGGSHMYAADFDGDGDADVFSADWAHGYGLAWYEQKPGPLFVKRQIIGSNTPDDLAKYGPVTFTQPHAVQVVDMDGDQIPDIVTGKTLFAHPVGFGDLDIDGKPYVYVFKTIRKPDANGAPVTFEPHLVDDVVGVGFQIGVGHANTDGVVDFCVATKRGLHVFLGK